MRGTSTTAGGRGPVSGPRDLRRRNWEPLASDPAAIDACGADPRSPGSLRLADRGWCGEGFKRPVLCTPRDGASWPRSSCVTAHTCRKRTRRSPTRRASRGIDPPLPLYDSRRRRAALAPLPSRCLRRPRGDAGRLGRRRCDRAGHILGSATRARARSADTRVPLQRRPGPADHPLLHRPMTRRLADSSSSSRPTATARHRAADASGAGRRGAPHGRPRRRRR